MIDAVLMIAGSFSRFTLFKFFCVANQKHQKNRKYIFLVGNVKKIKQCKS